MSDQPENLMLVYLRRLDAKMDSVLEEMRDLRHRMTTLELQFGQFAATEQNHYASPRQTNLVCAVMARFDRNEARVERLERQADILPAE